jgi:hypothetical protein
MHGLADVRNLWMQRRQGRVTIADVISPEILGRLGEKLPSRFVWKCLRASDWCFIE